MLCVFALAIVTICAPAVMMAGCSAGAGEEAAPGEASLVLSVAGGEAIDEVMWEISDNHIELMSGVIDTSAPRATASVEVFGLPPGSGYEVVMSATTTDATVRCEGSATFRVEAARVAEVYVYLNCKAEPRSGGARVDGTFNVCATLEKVVVTPLKTSIGNRIDLRAEAAEVDGDPIEYAWSATSGDIAQPEDSTTYYTCTEVGEHVIEVSVSDDERCSDGWSVPVACVKGEPPTRTWSEPEIIEDNDVKAASSPQVAVDDDGNAVVVFEQPDDGIWSIRANRYLAGDGWGIAETLEDSRLGTDEPRVVMDHQGNAITVWEQSALWAARLEPATGWSAPEMITESSGLRIGSPDLAVDASGAALVVWGQFGIVGGSFGRYDAGANRYDPLEGWGQAESLEHDDMSSARETQVAVDAAGNGLAIWLQSGQLWSCLYTPALGWSAPEVAVEDGQGAGPATYAELTLDDFGRGIAVWSRRDTSYPDYDVVAAHYTVDVGWDAPQVLDGVERHNANYPDLANDAEGNAIAVWTETPPVGTPPQVASLWARRYSPGAGWGPATPLEHDDAGSVRDPAVAMSAGGSAIVVSIRLALPPTYLWANHYEPDVGWGPPTPISATGARGFREPEVAMDALGRATAVWAQNDPDSTTPSIWASRYEVVVTRRNE